MPFAYDVSRLFLGPLSRTPRGIDRVDIEYARHFFRHSTDECYAVLPTIWGVRCYPRDRVLRGLDRLEQLWAEHVVPEEDQAYRSVRARLRGEASGFPRGARHGVPAMAARLGSLLRATGIDFGTSVDKGLPPGTAFLNIGQITLALPFTLRWLERRRDIRPFFMLHDVIPLERPEYVEPSAVKGHAAMVDQTARLAAGLIVTSQAAKAAVLDELRRRGAPDLPTVALPLPVQAVFRQPADPDPALAQVPYFVVCGAIEHRKNQLMLLEVWRRLLRGSQFAGEKTPHLVIVGSPGWQGKAIRDRFERSADVSNRVHVVSGLSTPALHRLLSGARGLLMPSLSEGFGLPVLEAGRLGIPVVASDIPAHREIGPPDAVFVDPIDGPGWEAAIRTLLDRERAAKATDDYGALTWDAYFVELRDFMDKVLKTR